MSVPQRTHPVARGRAVLPSRWTLVGAVFASLLAMLILDSPVSTESVPLVSAPTSHSAGPSAAARPAPAPPAPAGVARPTPTGPVPNGISGQWHLLFNDEFTGNSLGPVWCPGWFGRGSTNPINPSEIGPYLERDVFVADGSLHLREDGHNGALVSTNPQDGCHGSDPGFQFTYGVVEFRAWLPAAPEGIANWPTLWLDGQQWPQDGEINVLEGLGGRASACYHYGTAADWHDGNGVELPGADWAAGWHTYAARWEPGRITFYYDGKLVWSTTEGVVHTPMYVIIDDTVNTGDPVTPSTMEVDYVRVWQ